MPQLAAAGFYFAPAAAGDDTAVCFLCDKQLGGWTHGDDPVVEHHSHSRTCPWAVVCHERRKPTLVPTGAAMNKAREATFADWPHEKTRGFVGKSKKMAKAGWHHVPSTESPDAVECLYCGVELDGWEAKDDPLVEHEKRARNFDCVFFAGLKKGATLKIKEEATGRPLEVEAENIRPDRSVAVLASEVQIIERQAHEVAPTATDRSGGDNCSDLASGQGLQVGGKASTKRKLPKSKARSNLDKLQEPDEAEGEPSSMLARNTIPVVLQSARKKRKSEKADLDPPTTDDVGMKDIDVHNSQTVPSKRARRPRDRASTAEQHTTITAHPVAPVEDVAAPGQGGSVVSQTRGRQSRAPLGHLVDNAKVQLDRRAAGSTSIGSRVPDEQENILPEEDESGRAGRKRKATRGSTADATAQRRSTRTSCAVAGTDAATQAHPTKLVVIDESEAMQAELRQLASSVVKLEEAEDGLESLGLSEERKPVTRPESRASGASHRASGPRPPQSRVRHRSSARLATRNLEEVLSNSSRNHRELLETSTSGKGAEMTSSSSEPGRVSHTEQPRTCGMPSVKPCNDERELPAWELATAATAAGSSTTAPSSLHPLSDSATGETRNARAANAGGTTRRTSTRRRDSRCDDRGHVAQEFLMLDSRARPRAQRASSSSVRGTSSRRTRASTNDASDDRATVFEPIGVNVSTFVSANAQPHDSSAPRDADPSSGSSSLADIRERREATSARRSSQTAPEDDMPASTSMEKQSSRAGRRSVLTKMSAAAKSEREPAPAQIKTEQEADVCEGRQLTLVSSALARITQELPSAPASASSCPNGAADASAPRKTSTTVAAGAAPRVDAPGPEDDDDVVEIDAAEYERRVEREIVELAHRTATHSKAMPAAAGLADSSGMPPMASDRRPTTKPGTGARHAISRYTPPSAPSTTDAAAVGPAWKELETLDLYRPDDLLALVAPVVSGYDDLEPAQLDMTVERWIRSATTRQIELVCAECEHMIQRLLTGGRELKAAIMAS